MMENINIKLPDKFYEEEDRCGYTVSSQMKKVWAVLLDLIVEFDRVCRKCGIQYMASGGTMLGAVRHNGFIPWDDDVDLMMRREDYEKLCQVAEKEFNSPYFFQTYKTDRCYTRAFAKLVNIKTTAIQENKRSCGYKHKQGIYIDIFPLDNVCPNKFGEMLQEKKCSFYASQAVYSVYLSKGYKMSKETLRYKLEKTLYFISQSLGLKFFNVDENMRKLEECCKKYNHRETKYSSKLSFQPKNKKQWIESSYLSNLKYVDFEMIQMPIPPNYDIYLRQRYGNYMLPQNTGGYHGHMFFDTEKPYTEYI